MNTFIVYLRWNGHIERKYETAVNELDAAIKALRYFKGATVNSVTRIRA